MTKQKPMIGIVPSFDDGTMIRGGAVDRYYLRRDYTRVIASVGAIPLIINPDMSLMSVIALCDGIILSGGEDIDPMIYGQDRSNKVVRVEPTARYQWESRLIEACDNSRTPILGICYGMQILNVYYGGTLFQDINEQVVGSVSHYRTMHPVTFHHDFLGLKMAQVHEINSRHHQAIDQLANGFLVCAEAPDGVIEAIQGHGHYGMQWHPESDATGAHVYRAFVEACALDNL